MNVLLDDRRVRLGPSRLVGQGGEAEVYALGAGRVLKLFKQPDHPDFAGFLEQQRAARERLAEHQDKLPEFPGDLGSAVIGPEDLARASDGGAIVGYAMKRIDDAQPLYALGDARARRRLGPTHLMRALLSLHDAVGALHRRGVVIGDFNDLDVLVRGARAYLIDADSFQFGRYRCQVYSERFVDPLLCAPDRPAPELRAAFSISSDWYAFAVMAMRTLLSVGPYGGVYRPGARGARVARGRRPLERITIFDGDVRLPRPALHFRALTEPLLDYFRRTFVGDERAPMPRRLLESMRWRRCPSCGAEHARTRCPHCRSSAQIPKRRPPRSGAATRIVDPHRLEHLRRRARRRHDNDTHRYWLEGRRLLRSGALGAEHVGDVLASATQFWVGDTFGVGFYAAGRLQVGFVFDSRRRGLDDRVALEPLRGTLAEAYCALSQSRAWLFLREAIGPAMESRLCVIDRGGHRIATAAAPEFPWAAGIAGACAVGDVLLVPTDAGIIRLETDAGTIRISRTFDDTAPHLDAATTLCTDGNTLYAVDADRVTALNP